MTGQRIGLLLLAAVLLAACAPAGRRPAPPAPTPLVALQTALPTATAALATTAVTAPIATAALPTATAPASAFPSPSPSAATAAEPTATYALRPQPSPSLTPALAAAASPTAPATPQALPTATSLPASPEPQSFAAAPYVETLLVAPGQPGRLYALVQPGSGPLGPQPTDEVRLMISDDFARTWTAFPGGLPVPSSCLINISLDYFPPTVLYANTCQGLYVWQNGDWQRRSDRVTNLLAVVYGKPDSIWAAEPGKSVIRSDDGGRTWHDAASGLVNFGGMAALGIDPRDPNTVYGMIRPKYAGSYLRRISGSGQWQMMPGPVNTSTVDSGIAIDGASGALYTTTRLAPVQLWRSLNPNTMNVDDVRWELVHDFGDRVNVQLLASGWSPQGMALYANSWPLTPAPGGGASVGNPVLQRSLDGGNNWQPLATP